MKPQASIALLFGIICVSCGGETPAPASPLVSDAVDANVPATDLPSPPIDASSPQIDASSTDSAAPSAAPTSTPDPEAECATIAVPYEKKIRKHLHDCYRDGLKKDPNMTGTATVVMDLDINGKVVKVRMTDNKGLSAPVVLCLTKVVKTNSNNEDFSHCGSKSLSFPVKFVPPLP
jgi:hypothetical protein